MTDHALVVSPDTSILPASVDATMLIQKAIETGTPVETMEKLLAMRRELQAEHAHAAFFAALGKFQASCPVIHKNKAAEVKKDGRVQYTYRYADLAAIGKAITPLLDANGLSYRFDTRFEDAPPSQVSVCYVTHVAGHTESSEFRAPIDGAAKMNSMQQSASAQTYGKRYALCNALGILTGDDDDDGRGAVVTTDATKPATRSTSAPTDRPRVISDAQRRRMYAIWKKAGHADEAVQEWLRRAHSVMDTKLVPRDGYKEICQRLEDPAPLFQAAPEPEPRIPFGEG